MIPHTWGTTDVVRFQSRHALISVLCPSRGRPDSLARSIATLRSLAAYPERIEYLVAADPDDPDTCDNARTIGAACWIAPERYGYHQLNLYYNELARLSGGDWLLLWNDDADMETPHWDSRIRDLPPEIIVADLQTAHSPHLCTFPAVRRAAVEVVGAFSPVTCHCDTWWQDIARRLGAIRPVEVHVNHRRADLTGEHKDQTWVDSRGGYRTVDYYDEPIQAAITVAASHIKEALSL